MNINHKEAAYECAFTGSSCADVPWLQLLGLTCVCKEIYYSFNYNLSQTELVKKYRLIVAFYLWFGWVMDDLDIRNSLFVRFCSTVQTAAVSD